MYLFDNHLHVGHRHEHVSAWMYEELRKNWDTRGHVHNTEPIETEQRDGTGLVDAMDNAGIDGGLVMAGNWNRALPPHKRPYSVSNDFVADLVASSGGRLFGMASVDPIADPWAAAEDLERMVQQHGFRACKLYPTYQHYDPRDPVCYPLYETAIALDIPLQFHMGWSPVKSAMMEYQHPWILDEIGRKFPNLKVLICHLGNPWTDEASAVIARHENFFGDVSALGFWHPRRVYHIVHDFGCLNPYSKLLYGSENPFMTGFLKTMKNLDRIGRSMDMPGIRDDDLELILGGNARRLYKLDGNA